MPWYNKKMIAIIVVKGKNTKRSTVKTRNEEKTPLINHQFNTKKKQKENTSQINIQSLEQGMYQLHITSEGKNYSSKFIKE